MEKSSVTNLSLTSTRYARTLYHVVRELSRMDATAQRLLNHLVEIERQIRELQSQARSLKTSLEVAGIRPEWIKEQSLGEEDDEYAEKQPFENLTLVETCKRILADFGDPLSKNDFEYLAARGGYQFSTKDKANSVSITLRRLADKGYCRVVKGKGPHADKYVRGSEPKAS